MNKKRPVNLDLSTIRQPLPAIASILHRVTGIILFAGLLFLLYAFDLSLESAEGFAQVENMFESNFIAQFIAWGLLSALAYHVAAGVKHLIMDMGYFEELESAQLAAKAVLVVAAIGIVLAGVWVW